MKLFVATLLFASTLFYSGQAASVVKRSVPFKWESCSSVTDPPLVVESLEVSPLPVLIPGNITLSMRASNSRVIENMDMHVSVWKMTSWFNLPLPCVMGHGSCTHADLCRLVQNEDDEFVQLAEQMMEAGGGSMDCPIQPSTINIRNFQMVMPPLPDFPLLGKIIAGDYKVKVKITDHDTASELACYQLEVSVEEAVEPTPEPELLAMEEEEEECTGWFCW